MPVVVLGLNLAFLNQVNPFMVSLRKRARPAGRQNAAQRVSATLEGARTKTTSSELEMALDRSVEKIRKYRLGAKKFAVAYYLLKSEGFGPRKFTIDDLVASPLRSTSWDGVRNFQARNVLLSMQTGDFALFYHSNCKNAGVTGIVEVVKEAYVDETQFDSSNLDAYDSKATPENPRWYAVDVKLQLRLPRPITLEELKQYAVPGGPLEGMLLFTRARLSVQPVRPEHFQFILRQM
ncbi:hypothetical protein CCYA_CCYA04G1368 [Cyanidiococcus yangmingshanensis]|nr:hypothetical protein CCYA_CCYA04G1368 [Cyanidiococcus yangmingshanensis]